MEDNSLHAPRRNSTTVIELSSLEKRHVVLLALTRHGVLSNFVRSLKDSDSRLQSVLKPDPGEFLFNLHPDLYLNFEILR